MYNMNQGKDFNTEPPARLVSLDVFRGIIVAAMILVTDPGTYDTVYPQLRHAEWFGATAADMIFPCFLFIMGISVVLSIRSRLHRGLPKNKIAWRIFYPTIVLIILGLLLNGFPDYNWHELRLPGVLQRIGICYFCCGMFYIFTTDKRPYIDKFRIRNNGSKMLATIVILLTGYTALLMLVPLPGIGQGRLDSYGNLPAYIDRRIFGIHHLWDWGLTPGRGVTYDPEGILSTLPAIASTITGLFVGEWWMGTGKTPNKKAARLTMSGILLVISAVLLNSILPINKRLWTASFALLSSGVAMIVYSLIYVVVDIKKRYGWTRPFLILGTNAILAFVLSGLITTELDRIHIQNSNGISRTLHEWGNVLCVSIVFYPVNASLFYALVIVLLNMILIWPLFHKRIFLKI